MPVRDMATSSVTTDCWVPGTLFSLSKEPSDEEGSPTSSPGTGATGAGMGIGLGDEQPGKEGPDDDVFTGSP